MEGVDPIKLREYLCLGKPIVSVNLPEVKKLEKYVYIGNNEDDFVTKVGNALNEKDLNLIKHRIRVAKESDWSNKIIHISYLIDTAKKITKEK